MTTEALIARYVDQARKLLPPGLAFNRRDGSFLSEWLKAMMVEFARIHDRITDAYNESYPGTASELLPEWESLTGLPNSCTYLLTTDADRRDAVLNQLAVEYGQSAQDFIDLAADRGYAITIELWDTFRTGIHTIGHMPIYSDEWYYAMNVLYTPQSATLDAALECTLRAHAHSHVILHFNLTVGPPDYFVSHPRN